MIVVKDEDDKVDRNQNRNNSSTVSGWPNKCGTEDKDDFNREIEEDDLMTDVLNTKVIPKISMPSGKEYSAPSVFTNIEADDFSTLISTPWFDAEALAVEGFVDQYAIDEHLPGDIPLDWIASWC